MATGASKPQKQRIGLRAVAEAAGVCLMTASLSLRDSPTISEATRARVRAEAERLGYRPDPEIARLMGRLRASRVKSGSVVVAMLDLQTDKLPLDHPYFRRVRQGIADHLDALGYGSSVFRLRDYGGDAVKLLRVIRNRGITGCLLLPSNNPVTFPAELDWGGISVLAATSSVLWPRFHRVSPNQIFNAMTLIETMNARGYRKIGAILSESLEQRTAHHYSLALTWHGHRNRILILPDENDPEADVKRIADWLRHHQVDVIFAQNADMVVRAMRAGKLGAGEGQVGLLSLSTIGQPGIAYQDERPEYIGESAVSLLAGMMHNNETGIPEHPRMTTVEGEFVDGPSVRAAGRPGGRNQGPAPRQGLARSSGRSRGRQGAGLHLVSGLNNLGA